MKVTQGYVLTELGKGAVITVEHINDPKTERRTVYRLSSSGRTVRPELFNVLLVNELIKANDDGLPGFEVEAQTYSLRRSID